MNRNGFTLIELMVSIAIIGIMASYAMPSFERVLVRAQINEALAIAPGIKQAVAAYYNTHGAFPDDNAAAGLPDADKILGNYVTGVRVADGAVHFEFGNYINRKLRGKRLTLRPQQVIGSPASPWSWQCGLREPPAGMTAIGENRTDLAGAYLPLDCI